VEGKVGRELEINWEGEGAAINAQPAVQKWETFSLLREFHFTTKIPINELKMQKFLFYFPILPSSLSDHFLPPIKIRP